ncbi:MAG: alpha/beta hydrolase [Bacteroidota bacterium]
MAKKQRIQQHLKRIGILFISGLLLTMGFLYAFQDQLIFLPTTLPQDHSYTFAVPFKEFTLEAKDGALLNALHFTRKDPKGIIVYYHGNAGNLERWGNVVQFFVQKNWEVVVMDYRGYGKSTGERSEKALFSDAALFYQYALKYFDQEQILVYGRSLGTAMASKIAAQNQPAHLILETPFYNLYDIAKKRIPLLPLRSLLKYEFNSYQHLQAVNCPITILHGTADKVVPLDSGEKLYHSIPGTQKKIVIIPGGAHNNLVTFPEYLEEINALLGVKNS